MSKSTQTPEGTHSECPVCGKKVPAGDATCPHCGSLLCINTVRKLADHGVYVKVDAEGQITRIRFSGKIYNDSIIQQLAGLGDIETIDLRDTAVTATGAQRLRRLLPNATIHH